MAILVSQASSSSNNPLSLTSNDANNTFYGSSVADNVTYAGTGNFTMYDISNGDELTFAQNGAGATISLSGNTVSLVTASGQTYTLGGIASGESFKVTFSGDSKYAFISRTGDVFTVGGEVLVNAAAPVGIYYGTKF
jgi:hypothetical protein